MKSVPKYPPVKLYVQASPDDFHPNKRDAIDQLKDVLAPAARSRRTRHLDLPKGTVLSLSEIAATLCVRLISLPLLLGEAIPASLAGMASGADLHKSVMWVSQACRLPLAGCCFPGPTTSVTGTPHSRLFNPRFPDPRYIRTQTLRCCLRGSPHDQLHHHSVRTVQVGLAGVGCRRRRIYGVRVGLMTSADSSQRAGVGEGVRRRSVDRML